jgi:hypothetical protein
MTLKFRSLELRREDIYDCPTQLGNNSLVETAELAIKASSISGRASFETGLARWHDINANLTNEEIEAIVEICKKAAIRTAEEIYRVSQDV